MSKQLMAVALAAAAVIAAPAQATTVALDANGAWNAFDVDSMIANDFGTGWIDNTTGDALNFTFTIAAGRVGTLTVVDAEYAGDTFLVTNFGSALGTTSGVPVGTYDGSRPVTNFDAALAQASFSRGVFQLQAGQYSISGSLLQSVQFFGSDLDATTGAVRLTTSAVPESSAAAMLLAGLAAAALLARRRPCAKSI
jgi:MYXO-CTERM domain-containing protein